MIRRRDAEKPDALPLVVPTTRRALFRQALSVRFGSMIPINLVCFLFYLPALVWTEMSLRAIPTTDGGNAATFASEQLIGSYLFGLLICFTIAGPMQAGLARLMRNWARGENCYPWDTLFGGMKQNLGQSLLAGALSGVVPLLSYSVFAYYGQMSETASLLYLIPLGLCGVFSIILIMMLNLIWTLMVTYTLPFGRLIKNAFLLTILELPRSFLMMLCSLIPALIAFGLSFLLPSHTGLIVVLCGLYYAVIGLALDRFLAASFANRACEKHMNSRIEGARVDIGLASERVANPAETQEKAG